MEAVVEPESIVERRPHIHAGRGRPVLLTALVRAEQEPEGDARHVHGREGEGRVDREERDAREPGGELDDAARSKRAAALAFAAREQAVVLEVTQLPPALRDGEQHAQEEGEHAVRRRGAKDRCVQMDVRDGVRAPAHRNREQDGEADPHAGPRRAARGERQDDSDDRGVDDRRPRDERVAGRRAEHAPGDHHPRPRRRWRPSTSAARTSAPRCTGAGAGSRDRAPASARRHRCPGVGDAVGPGVGQRCRAVIAGGLRVGGRGDIHGGRGIVDRRRIGRPGVGDRAAIAGGDRTGELHRRGTLVVDIATRRDPHAEIPRVRRSERRSLVPDGRHREDAPAAEAFAERRPRGGGAAQLLPLHLAHRLLACDTGEVHHPAPRIAVRHGRVARQLEERAVNDDVRGGVRARLQLDQGRHDVRAARITRAGGTRHGNHGEKNDRDEADRAGVGDAWH